MGMDKTQTREMNNISGQNMGDFAKSILKVNESENLLSLR